MQCALAPTHQPARSRLLAPHAPACRVCSAQHVQPGAGVLGVAGGHDWRDDVVIPEACVLDPIRCRALCSEGGVMLNVVEQIEGFQVLVGGKTAEFSLLRAKNKFTDCGKKVRVHSSP